MALHIEGHRAPNTRTIGERYGEIPTIAWTAPWL